MMMLALLMHVPVLKLFRGRLAQTHHFYIEMQLIARKGVIEIQRHVVTLDRIDTGIARLARIISDR